MFDTDIHLPVPSFTCRYPISGVRTSLSTFAVYQRYLPNRINSAMPESVKHDVNADFELSPVYSLLINNQAMLYAIMETQADILATLHDRSHEAEFEKLVERVEEEFEVVSEYFRHHFGEPSAQEVAAVE